MYEPVYTFDEIMFTANKREHLLKNVVFRHKGKNFGREQWQSDCGRFRVFSNGNDTERPFKGNGFSCKTFKRAAELSMKAAYVRYYDACAFKKEFEEKSKK